MNVWAKIPAGQPSTVRYTMTEIMNIWNDANDPHWDAILDEVVIQYGYPSQKYDQFFNRAWEAGVDH